MSQSNYSFKSKTSGVWVEESNLKYSLSFDDEIKSLPDNTYTKIQKVIIERSLTGRRQLATEVTSYELEVTIFRCADSACVKCELGSVVEKGGECSMCGDHFSLEDKSCKQGWLEKSVKTVSVIISVFLAVSVVIGVVCSLFNKGFLPSYASFGVLQLVFILGVTNAQLSGMVRGVITELKWVLMDFR